MEFWKQRQENKPLGLKEGLDEFVAVHVPARNFSKRTRHEYQSDLEDLVEFLEEKGVKVWDVVSLRDLQRYQAELDYRGLAPSSRNRKTYTIKTFFNYLYQAGHLREDPSRQLIPPHVSRKEPRFLPEEEYQALREQIDNARDRAIIEVLLQTGIKVSEMVGLTLNDL